MDLASRDHGLIFCVAEDTPRFRKQVWRWFLCLTEIAGVPASNLCLAMVASDLSPKWLSDLAARGVRTISVPRFDARSPHCNKISGLQAVIGMTDGKLVISDCDLAFLADPSAFPNGAGAVSAKVVDHPNPPIEVLGTILAEAGVPPPPRVRLAAKPRKRTYLTNTNGGLVVLDAATARDFAMAWDRRARWLMDRAEMLKDWHVHVDQVSMLLAIADLGLPFVRLGERHNFPTHLKNRYYFGTPLALHYHDRVGADGLLLPYGRRGVDRQIARVNAALASHHDRVAVPD